MSNICDFDRILKAECNLLHFTRNCKIKDLNDFEEDEVDFWRAGFVESRIFKCKGERSEHMLHYGQVFGNVFERRESKCCGVSMRHRRKVRGEQVTTLLIAQQIKTKNINVIPGQLFCRHCKAKFLLETRTHCIDDEDKVQSVTDTDNEFTECQTPRKKLNWHFTCQSTRCTSTQPYK